MPKLRINRSEKMRVRIAFKKVLNICTKFPNDELDLLRN